MSRRDDAHGCWADWDYDQAVAAAYAAHLDGECDVDCDWCQAELEKEEE